MIENKLNIINSNGKYLDTSQVRTSQYWWQYFLLAKWPVLCDVAWRPTKNKKE